ncbi:hypothetical protein K443DRAFT_15692 [Laccaria amethystina LaAM-08-1]|uniref:Uncharacterized protein n=1 Tax=Laccaria amethystina LaAM-08-1 TaxID=1095629 RepID=A0A0C9WL22_9AGAR|nr:hypothetical protein K443DRAFT_15692 [Laccaria amethystina LaAM-08-1]
MDLNSLTLSKSELSTLFDALLDSTVDPELSQKRLLLALKLSPYLPAGSSSLVPDLSVSVQIANEPTPLNYHLNLFGQPPGSGIPSLRTTKGYYSGLPLPPSFGVDPAQIIGTRFSPNSYGLLSPSPTPSPSSPLPFSTSQPFSLSPFSQLPSMPWPTLSCSTPSPGLEDDVEMVPVQVPIPQTSAPQPSPGLYPAPFPAPSPSTPSLAPQIEDDEEMSWPATPPPLLLSPFSTPSPLTPPPLTPSAGLNDEEMAFSSQPNEDGGSDAELRGSSLELEAWLNDGQPLRGADNGHLNNGVGQGSRHAGGDDEGRDGEGGDEDGEDEDNGPPPPLWLPPGVIAANPYCPRGGKAARLLRAAANLTKEQARRYSQWSLEGRYHEQEGEEAHDQHPEEQAASVGEGRLPARSFHHLYPTASTFPTAEEPPADFDIREFLSAVCVQAKNCLPGFTKSCKKGTTTPEELIQWIVHSYSFVQPNHQFWLSSFRPFPGKYHP